MIRTKQSGVATASVMAIALALAASPAAAQDVPDTAGSPAQPASGGGLEDIVVTARKVAENNQNVPVAITAFSGAALQQANVVTAADVAKLTPGLAINQAASTGNAALFTIRGQVQTDVLATLDPSVGVYVDGYYWARAYGITANLLDVSSFQTLKGPQGTLFGRNTTGGAVLIQTNDPNFEDGYSVLASGGYGRFNAWSGTGIVNLPLVDDRLAVRIAYQRNKRDGYVTDTTTGRKLGSQDDYTIRAKLLFKPTDTLSILLSGEQYRTDYLNAPYREQFVAADKPAAVQIGSEVYGGGIPATAGCALGLIPTCAADGQAAGNAAAAAANSGDRVTLNALPSTYAKTRTYTATATLDTFFGAIKAIGGYRDIRAETSIDLDGGPYNLLATRGFQDLSQYSGELQITGKALDNRIDFAAGLFYFHESGSDSSYSQALNNLTALGAFGAGGGFDTPTQHISGTINNDSQGLYGQATFHATDQLSFTGGLRYSADDKQVTARNGAFSFGTSAGPGVGAIFRCDLASCPERRKASFDGISWTIGADYKLNPDILLYAKASRGFRSGGQNLRGTQVFPNSTDPFKPETATSYEGGIKSEFFDRRVRVNLAGYYTVVKDIQRSGLVFNTVGNSTTVITNAGQATIYGGELEANAILFGGFRLGASVGYTHPKYDRYTDSTGFDKSNEKFANVPKWTVALSPSYSQEFGSTKFSLRGDFAYQSKMYLYNIGYYEKGGVIYDASTPDASGNPVPVSAAESAGILKGVIDPAGWLVNARAALSFNDDQVEVAIWGKNLGNRRDLIVSLPITALGEVAGVRRDPRTFGVTVTAKFLHLGGM
ncbi:MAG: TonB-dependent receptor [Sphingobium sp.]